MLILAISLLIILGIILLVAEFFISFGTVVMGIAGLVLTALGVFLAYSNYGTTFGHYTLLATAVVLVVTVYLALRARTWKKIVLESEVDGKVNSIEEFKIKTGDHGVTVSRLAPMGKVRVHNSIVEAKSIGIYIEENTPVEVIKSNQTNIVVKPLN